MLPVTATLGVRRYQEGATDSHNNPVESWAASTDWPVYGYGPGGFGYGSGGNSEPFFAGRDLSLVVWTVYAPVSKDAPTERDLVVLDGEEYRVEGRPQDFSNGPFGRDIGGLVVLLKRAEG